MKPSSLLIGCLLSLLVIPFSVAGQGKGALHLIISVDNYNEDIRDGCQKDYQRTTAFFKNIAQDAGMAFQLHTVGFVKNEVFTFFKNFTCTPDDALIFFYSGHGFRNEDDQVIWPLMYYCKGLNNNLQSCGVPLDWVHEMLISKHPRMSITLGNSCNNVVANEDANKRAEGLKRDDDDQPDAASLRNLELLTRYRGHILASGASPGQVAYTNDDEGSYFINELVEVLSDGLLHAQNPTSWASILKKTRDEVQKKKPDQRPQFLIVEDNKKMFSEGKDKYQEKASFEVLKLAVPETGVEEYDNWETEDFDEGDFSTEWETEFDSEAGEEMALEDLPLVLLYGLQLDDGEVSDEEASRALNFYLELMETYDYDAETAELLFELYLEETPYDPSELEEPIQEFLDFLDPEQRSVIASTLSKLSDNPNAQQFKTFLKTLRQ